MDNLTHGLTGALMGQMGLKKKTGLGLAALVLGANLPDIDVVGLFWLDSIEALGFRRGITHGPIGVVLLPLGLAALLWGFDRWQDGRGKRPAGRNPVSFKWLYLLGLIGAISHTLMDWLNVYGVRFLYPFDKSWYYGDTLFIIDVWLWAWLALGIWWSARSEKRGGNWKQAASVSMFIAVLYVGANIAFSATINATTRAPYNLGRDTSVIASPVPAFFWQREILTKQPGEGWKGGVYTLGSLHYPKLLTSDLCEMPDLGEARKTNTQLDGFLTWSRAPFAEAAEDGSIILRDARFYDPLARDRFSIALPDIRCAPLAGEPAAD